MSAAPDEAFVFNIVWTGRVFPYLRYFVQSQMDRSQARFRFVVNGCPADQVALMEDFAREYPDRVVEVFEAWPTMGAHGVALDVVRGARDDGDYFCLIDPDIIATGPFVPQFAAALDNGCAGVTSGRGVWADEITPPEGNLGVAGEHFYSRDGYLFGSPHFAMYHRAALEDTMARWGIGFGSAGPELDDRTKAALAAEGHDYHLYDTGKLANVLLQVDGKQLCHFESDALLHIGGVSHYLSPPEYQHEPAGVEKEPKQNWPWPAARLEVARFTGALLRSLCDGRPEPAMPEDLQPEMAEKLELVRHNIVEVMRRYGDSETRR